jgi:probable F420-dependent oxidoreductase
MKVTASLPFDHLDRGPEFVSLAAIREIGAALEEAGFDGGAVTDHPVPTGRWLDNGGHFAQDPFVVLSLLAAATTRLRLQTGILVLPYRNPFLVAKMVATLDAFSNGRVTLGVGAGYLKGEYKALGVDFDSRNEIMDEYLRALKAAWTQDEFTFEGNGYTALGNRILPRPVQQPHPPIYCGGNSKRAIRRAVEFGDAWFPFFTPAALSATARTAALTGDAEVAEGIAYLLEQSEKMGRAVPPKVILGALPGSSNWEASRILDEFAKYRAMGIEGIGASLAGDTREEWIASAHRFGEEVIAKL